MRGPFEKLKSCQILDRQYYLQGNTGLTMKANKVGGNARCNLVFSQIIKIPKAELLQLNRTQFPSLGIFVNKKVGNRKN